MKNNTNTRPGLVLIILLVILGTVVMVDPGVNQTSEIQGITTTTYIDVVGTATNSVSLAWTSSTGSIQDGAPLTDGEKVQTTGYSEETMAVNGHTVYSKDFSLNTGNKIRDQSNLKSSRIITFEGIDGGRMISDESLLIDTAGTPTSAADSLLCPFGASSIGTIPAFCNIVTAGSSVDATYISLATQAESRTITSSADVPVALSYNINVHGLMTANGEVPAQGSVKAYIRAHLQEGRGSSLIKSEDLVYEETSTASGLITSFVKSMSYQSGLALV